MAGQPLARAKEIMPVTPKTFLQQTPGVNEVVRERPVADDLALWPARCGRPTRFVRVLCQQKPCQRGLERT